MIDDIRAEPVVLFLRMQPSWVFVDDIRRFVESFCAASCPAAGREEHLALAVHELVQNAIANAAAPGVELELEVDRAANHVRVSVSNQGRPGQIELLRERLARVNRHADALDAYLEAMDENPNARGGLGLARIRFECSLELALQVEGDRVTLHATGDLRAPILQRVRHLGERAA